MEYDAETLANEFYRDQSEGLKTAMPVGYFPDDDPTRLPVNFWRPFAFLLISNWINDLYQATPFDLAELKNLATGN